MKVLLVEDNPYDVKILELFLQHYPESINLKVIADGQEAIAFIKKDSPYEHAKTPQVIILDLHLPKKTGLEILREIRADNSLSELPVFMMTSSEAKEDMKQAYQLKVNQYFLKSGSIEETFSNFRSIFAKCRQKG